MSLRRCFLLQLLQGFQFLGDKLSNNQAEYAALQLGLQVCLPLLPVSVLGIGHRVDRQMQGSGVCHRFPCFPVLVPPSSTAARKSAPGARPMQRAGRHLLMEAA